MASRVLASRKASTPAAASIKQKQRAKHRVVAAAFSRDSTAALASLSGLAWRRCRGRQSSRCAGAFVQPAGGQRGQSGWCNNRPRRPNRGVQRQRVGRASAQPLGLSGNGLGNAASASGVGATSSPLACRATAARRPGWSCGFRQVLKPAKAHQRDASGAASPHQASSRRPAGTAPATRSSGCPSALGGLPG